MNKNQQKICYWNIKSDKWVAPFHKINFTIHAPEGVVLGEKDCYVYSGNTGDTTETKDFQLVIMDNVLEGKSNANFTSNPGQSVTVLLFLPETAIQQSFVPLAYWIDYSWMIIIGILLLLFFLIWLKYGKDDHVVSAINYYPPKDIDPAIAGFLIDDKGDNSDLIALLPYWAANGHLKMEEIPKAGLFRQADMKLTKLKPLAAEASLYEELLFNGLFGSGGFISLNGNEVVHQSPAMDFINDLLQKNKIHINFNKDEVLVSSLRNTFFSTMKSAQLLLSAETDQYYVNESKKAQKKIATILVVIGALLTPMFFFLFGIPAAIGILVACIALFSMNEYMIKKNEKGNQLFADLKGFKQFIKVADEQRLQFLLQEDPNYFDKTMAYALAFGMLEKWAKKFDNFNLKTPNWYASSSSSNNSIVLFSKSFSSSFSGMQSHMVSSPGSSGSSSGGGSSGGGGGGGGGGSW